MIIFNVKMCTSGGLWWISRNRFELDECITCTLPTTLSPVANFSSKRALQIKISSGILLEESTSILFLKMSVKMGVSEDAQISNMLAHQLPTLYPEYFSVLYLNYKNNGIFTKNPLIFAQKCLLIYYL